jgi:hypothetical protein
VSSDPIKFRGGDVNLYGYVKNNPTNLTDQFGLAAPDRSIWVPFEQLLGQILDAAKNNTPNNGRKQNPVHMCI